jgi:UDP-N-acetylglucosamine 1-carboxyvinyltransferase
MLKGKVNISGSKNAAIPIICTSIIKRGKVVLKNIPRISDIFNLLKIIKELNCKVVFIQNTLIIDSTNIKYKSLNNEHARKIRGSYYLIGPLLFLFGKCEIALPGGCSIGERPIDAHIDMLESYGNKVEIINNVLCVVRLNETKELTYKMIKKSVGASINAIICSCLLEKIVLSDLVIEPEAKDVISFMKKIGFEIIFNQEECIIYNSVFERKIIKHKIIPDRIEAMTFIILGLLTGNIKVCKSNIEHYQYPLNLLIKAGYHIKIKKGNVIAKKFRGKAFDIETGIYPKFPTDMQPLFGVLLSTSKGNSQITETIFENRMHIYEDLNLAKACVNVVDNKAYIIGVDNLSYSNYYSKDLRHSAAVVLLALTYGGTVDNLDVLNRGYEVFFYKIRQLRAVFKIINIKN